MWSTAMSVSFSFHQLQPSGRRMRSWRCPGPGQGDPKASRPPLATPHCQLPCPLDHHHPSQQKRQSAGPAGRIQFLLLCIVYSIDWILAMAQFFLTVLQQYAVQVSTQFCCLALFWTSCRSAFLRLALFCMMTTLVHHGLCAH